MLNFKSMIDTYHGNQANTRLLELLCNFIYLILIHTRAKTNYRQSTLPIIFAHSNKISISNRIQILIY